MKSLKYFSVLILLVSVTTYGFAQKTKTETLKVSGECGMCKKKIEKAAKDAGATYASWSAESKELTVKYNSLSTNSAKIQKKIAGAGYDTPDFKATDEAYNKLEACCQYDRGMGKEGKCCTDGCEMKDGKCVNEAACKEKGCCKDSEKCKAMGCCSNEKEMAAAKMSCCSNEKGMANTKQDCSKDMKGSKMNCCSKSNSAKSAN
jgi:hypothetical protein